MKMLLRASAAVVCVWTSTVGAADTYISPTALAVSADQRTIYIAEETAGQIAVFDIATKSVVDRIRLPVSSPPSGLALSNDGAVLYVSAATTDGKAYAINTTSRTVVDTFTVGHTPMSPVVSPDGATLYVCNRFDNTVSAVDVATRAETVIPVTREPITAALTPNGARLAVANFLSNDATTNAKISAVVSVIETATGTVSATIRLPNGSSSVRGICVSPDSRHAYAVHLLGKYHITPNQIERGWTWNNVLSIIDLSSRTLTATVLLDDLDLGAGNPWDIQCTADGSGLVIAHAGTHEISVIDRAGLHAAVEGMTVNDAAKDFSLLVGIRRRIALKGKGPRALALIGTKVYVAEYFTGTMSIVDIDPAVRPKPVSVSLGAEPAFTDIRRGELIYHDATLSFQNWLSCSSCHPDARADGFNWDELNDGFGNAKQTKSHLYSHVTPPTTITGCRPDAETSVRAGLTYAYFNILPESDAVAVDEYLKALTPVQSPYLVDGQLSGPAARGKVLFNGSASCSSCHAPATYYTDMQPYDVGTGFDDRHATTRFDTPTLIEVWRTAPYLYRGQAATMKEVLTTFNYDDKHGTTSHLSQDQIDDLAEYVLSIGNPGE